MLATSVLTNPAEVMANFAGLLVIREFDNYVYHMFKTWLEPATTDLLKVDIEEANKFTLSVNISWWFYLVTLFIPVLVIDNLP